MSVYLEAGVRGATLKAIAERADVSRGTILHHFGDGDGLLDALLDRLLEDLELPDDRALDGLTDPEARLRRYVREMVAFFRRSTPWWQVFQSEMGRPSVQAREARYWASMGRLQSAALGPELAADRAVQVALGAILHPGTVGSILWALEGAGTSAEDADRVIGDLVVGYVMGPVRSRSASGQAVERSTI